MVHALKLAGNTDIARPTRSFGDYHAMGLLGRQSARGRIDAQLGTSYDQDKQEFMTHMAHCYDLTASVPVGPLRYTIYLHRGLMICGEKKGSGLCYFNEQAILITDRMPPAKRLSVFWHELAHAWWGELVNDPQASLDHEPFARVIGVAATSLTAQTIEDVEHVLNQV